MKKYSETAKEVNGNMALRFLKSYKLPDEFLCFSPSVRDQ